MLGRSDCLECVQKYATLTLFQYRHAALAVPKSLLNLWVAVFLSGDRMTVVNAKTSKLDISVSLI